MSPDKTKQLIDANPKVFLKIKHLECGDGWFNLLRATCGVIENLIEQLPEEVQPQVYATQIKEKFGSLRFYTSHSVPIIDGAIDLAEEISNNTCEVCGLYGGHKNINGWLATLCDTHYQERLESRKIK